MRLSSSSYEELVTSFNNKRISKDTFEYIKNKYYQKIDKQVSGYT